MHKDIILCAVYNGKKHELVKEYSTLTNSIQKMGDDLLDIGVSQIAMESTGIYWIPIWNILEVMGFDLLLVNPYLIKQMPGRKSDAKDARWIASLLYKGMLRGSLVPNYQIRELRTYSRKYVKLQQRQTSVLQAMERTLEMCNIRLTSFVSNISAQSVQNVIKAIIQGETSAEILLKLVHSRIVNKHSREKIQESLTGFITDHQRFTLELSLEEYELLVQQSERCLKKMENLCKEHYLKELELLQTIPGISLIAAMLILAETGADMKAFEDSGKLSGWTGLRPRNDESAGKFKSTATTKGNRFLRAILVQVAWAASRTKGSFFMGTYSRLAMRKGRKKALIAVARKISTIVWNVLNFEKEYDPTLLPVYDPIKLKAKIDYHQKEITRIGKLTEK